MLRRVLRLARMLWGTYHHQNGDLTKLLKSVQKKVPQSALLSAGRGGWGGAIAIWAMPKKIAQHFQRYFPNHHDYLCSCLN